MYLGALFTVRAFMCLLLRQHRYEGGGHRSGWQVPPPLPSFQAQLTSSPSSSFHLSSSRAAEGRLPAEAPADLAGSWGAVLNLEPSGPSIRRTNAPRRRARLPGQPPAREDPDRFPARCENKLGARAQFQA